MMNATREITVRMLQNRGGVEKLAELVRQAAFVEGMQKWAQEGLAGALEGIAVPALFGMGGYAASKNLGLGKYFGLPDEFVGPALGLGAAMPAARMARDYLRRRRAESEPAEEQGLTREEMAQLERQFALEEQAQNFLTGAGGHSMGIPMQGGMPAMR